MEDDDLTPAERERMRRFDEWLRVSRGVLAKWAVPLALAFCVLAALFAAALVRRAAASPFRYVAETRLLFFPRQAPKVQAMGDRQLLGVLDRASVKRAAGARLGLAPEAAAGLEGALSLKQEKKPTNLFTVSAAAPSPEAAVARANAYAEALVAEYADWRTRDLASWDETLESRRAALQERIAAVEAEETAAKSATGVVSPVETLTLLNGLVSDQRRNRSRLGVELANEEARRKRLEEAAGGQAAAVAAAAPRLRRRGEELAALDAEIAKLREVYTDLNPRLQGKLEDRAALVADYLAMLRESGLEGVGPEDVGRVEEAARGLAESSARIEALEGSRRALDAEISDNEAKIDALLAAVPALERAKVALEGLGRNLLELEEQQRDLRHLASTSAGDLRRIEPASEAEDSNPAGPKNIALALAGAGFATALLACLVLAWELAAGKTIGAAELGAGGDVRVLGSVPRDGAPEALGRDAARAAAAAFGADGGPKRVVLVCPLAGARVPAAFDEALDWSLAMSGRHPFRVEPVAGADFVPPEGASTMSGIVRKGERGWLPVAGLHVLDASELRLLRADLDKLRETTDDVFVSMPPTFRRGGPLFDQLLALSDAALLVAAAGRTPRADLRRVRRRAGASGKPLFGLVVGADPRAVRREMED